MDGAVVRTECSDLPHRRLHAPPPPTIFVRIVSDVHLDPADPHFRYSKVHDCGRAEFDDSYTVYLLWWWEGVLVDAEYHPCQ